MCGIVAYTGFRNAKETLIDCLTRLEYRGYDSVGIALAGDDGFFLKKIAGRVADLKEILSGEINTIQNTGIGHVRWATHGVPNTTNAHPHFSCDKEIVLVHNGIIENYRKIKKKLLLSGHRFTSETDTEVIAHLLEEYYAGEPIKCILKVVKMLEGSFALAIMFRDRRREIYGVRNGAPLILGVGKDENFLASDVPAILNYTRKVYYLKDGEVAKITDSTTEVFNKSNEKINVKYSEVKWSASTIEKGGFPHFLLKEICEQPISLKNTLSNVILENNSFNLDFSQEHINFRNIKKVIIVACGTAYHAGLVGKYALQHFTKLPVDVYFSSEFRYFCPHLDRDTLVIGISQSGETADTLVSVKLAGLKNTNVLSICNVQGSSLTRISDSVLYTRAGPEISVASTKAYTSQLMLMFLLSIYIAYIQNQISLKEALKFVEELKLIPEKVSKILRKIKLIEAYARKYYKYKNFMYIARGCNYPNALEGALKIKEISYIHAEGYPAGEMKHGPLALVCSSLPVVSIVVHDSVYEKVLSNLQEIKARRGKIICITDAKDEAVRSITDDIIEIPKTYEFFYPILTVVPLQILAYYIAVLNNKDVDRPRNLAKSVTVE